VTDNIDIIYYYLEKNVITKSENKMKEVVQKLSHLDHILKRPDSYVGSTEQIDDTCWVLNDSQSFTSEPVRYSPALLKIFDEVLVNAIDRNSMYPDKVTKIHVNIKDQTIIVTNNGPLGGISIEKNDEGTWNPELTFGHLLTSTNYDDSTQRVVGGRNGYGAKLANIYSTKFKISIDDAENRMRYEQTWENNMRTCHPPTVKKYNGKQSSVTIEFTPDWTKLGGYMTGIHKVIDKRVYDAAVCTSPKCSVELNESKINLRSFESYASMYLEQNTPLASFTSGDRWSVIVAPSSEYRQVSFVNGICTTKGGTHVDHVMNMIVSGIQEELGKKVKLSNSQIKNSLFVFVKCTLVNPSFSSQIKSECTLKVSQFGSVFEPPKNFAKSILTKTGIQNDLLALSKLKEQKELTKQTDGTKRSTITGIPKLDDANYAGTAKSGKCTLIVTEGDSAKTLAVSGLSVVGRDYYGVFPLRGKCKNVRDASVAQLLANQEFTDLKKILGLKQDKVYTSLSELRYGRLMIMTDADNDGSHIKGLILNMIHFFWPSLLGLHFVVSLVTPIVKAVKGNETKTFYTESSFRRWFETVQGPSWKIKYYKGLGTSTSMEAREYFKNIQNLTVGFADDTKTTESIVLAFDKGMADARKTWLLENTEKDPSKREIQYGTVKSLSVSDFVHYDLVNFSLADLRRSIASMVDGFKPSQRKVLYACLTKNLTDDMKVAQLAAYVSEKTSYHHGEMSLADTIVKLAHDFMGSNNINLLEPSGQFGTRLMGGKDCSQTRYIYTKLCPVTRVIFDKHDDDVLNYLMDDGKSIEPEYFVPIVPMVLVNGSEGIGTGFSSYVPPDNPNDIIENIQLALSGKSLKPMNPWFKGFRGLVTKTDETSWTATGLYSCDGTTYRITELPPGRWTQDFKEYLDTLVEKKLVTNYENNSTTEQVNFSVYGYTGTNPVKDFKLEKVFHTTNMHLFHPRKGIRKYTSPEEILVDFLEIRLDYYKKRKEHLVRTMTEELCTLQNKARFIQMVIEGTLLIFKRSKTDIETELKSLKFDGPSYDYLFNIKTYQYTSEYVDKLNNEVKVSQETLEGVQRTTTLKMWKSDLLKMSTIK